MEYPVFRGRIVLMQCGVATFSTGVFWRCLRDIVVQGCNAADAPPVGRIAGRRVIRQGRIGDMADPLFVLGAQWFGLVNNVFLAQRAT